MGRRYYCDYCDKTFIDDVEARKKHLNSAHHIKLKKLHYDSLRDLRTILREESAKVPCRRFLGSGFCQFDSTCKYTHYSPEQLWQIKQQILEEDQAQFFNTESRNTSSVESWIDKYNHQKDNVNKECATAFWNYPEVLENRPDLPVSLRKFKPEHFTSSEFDEWG